jgi:hypothetical protein
MGTSPVDLFAEGNSVEAEPQRDRIARQRHLDGPCASTQRRAFTASKPAYQLRESSEFIA